jgi:cytosine/adenosine deaminase-related metal-dependent hydrolase
MLTLITARWLLPVAADPIADGALLIGEDGRIAAVGPAETMPATPAARLIELGEAVLLPGLVNIHAHPELTAMRGLLEDLPFHVWIATLVRAKKHARLEAEDYAVAARCACVEAMRAGITTIGATEESGAALDALRETGMRGVVFQEVFGPAPEQAEGALRDLRERLATLRERETELVRLGVSPHAPYTVSDRLFQLVCRLARDERLPVAIHAAESEAEQALVARGGGPFAQGLERRGIETPARGASTIALLDRLGVLEAQPLLIHCVHVSPEDIRRMAEAGAKVAHCPAANARLGHGIAPIAEMRAAGIAVGIGSDSVASNNRMDLLEEARLAHMFQRSRLQSPVALPATELLRAVTLDGARALSLEGRIGTLETGKDADLCAVALDAPHVQPIHDPLAALFFAARASDVVLTAVRGRVLFHRGELEPESAHLQERLAHIALRLSAALHEEPLPA